MMSTNELVLELDDRVSAPINKMIGSINVFVNEVRFAGDVINNSFTTNSIVNMSQEFNTAITSVDNFAGSISNAASNQDSFNNAVKKSEGIASKAFSVFKNAIGVDSWSDGVKKIVDMSDKYTQMSTKLSSIAGEGENLADIQNKIFGSANSGRTSYTAMADAVSQLGKEAKSAFGSTDEIIGFADSVNKSLAIGGLSEDERTSAMSYVSDSMSDGSISGDELNEIMSYSPVIGESLSKYMGVPENLVQEYANEGKLSAEAFKNAVLSSSGEIEQRLGEVPLTFGDAWTTIKNSALKALTPIFSKLSSFLNSDFGAQVLNGILSAFSYVEGAVSIATDLIISGIQLIADNWNFVQTLLFGAIAIFGILAVSMVSAALTSAAAWIMANLPLILIMSLILMIIGLLKEAGYSWQQIGSIIGGVLGGLYAAAMNNFIVPIQNIFAELANFVGNLFADPVAAVKMLFLGMVETVLNYTKTMAQGIEDFLNSIPGISVDLTSGIESLSNKIQSAKEEIKSESDWTEYVEKWDSVDTEESIKAGAEILGSIGSALDNFNVSDAVNEATSGLGIGNGGEGDGVTEPSGFVPTGGNSFDTTGGMGDALNNIATDTSAISNEVATSAENEEYLRKIAERDVIVRYVTPNISVSMNNKNNIQNGMDIDGVIDHLARGTAAAMAGMGEGA